MEEIVVQGKKRVMGNLTNIVDEVKYKNKIYKINCLEIKNQYVHASVSPHDEELVSILIDQVEKYGNPSIDGRTGKLNIE